MGGTELVKRALEVNPQLRTIYVSGYSGHALPPGVLPLDQSFLQKPFSMAVLARQVRSVLDGKAKAAQFVQ